MTKLRTLIVITLALLALSGGLWQQTAASAAPVGGASVYLLISGDAATDSAVTSTLTARGFSVTEGVEWSAFDGSQVNLNLTDVVVFLNNHNWSDDDMPVDGQQALVDFVNAGGGLITGGWSGYNANGNDLQTLEAVFPFTYSSFVSQSPTTYTQVSAEATLNANLPTAFTFALGDVGGTEEQIAAKAGATEFYSSSGTGQAGLVGWHSGSGNVASFSNLLTATSFDNADFATLFANAVEWADQGRFSLSCEPMQARVGQLSTMGYEAPIRPILHREPGYQAPVDAGESGTAATRDAQGRAVSADVTYYADPLSGGYSLVNLDNISTANIRRVGIGGGMLDTALYRATEYNDTTDVFDFVAPPVELPGTTERAGFTLSTAFEVEAGDLNGDNQDEQLLAWRPFVNADSPIHLKISGFEGTNGLLASAPAAYHTNGTTWLFARGYDDALWVAEDGSSVTWQRCGGTLASGVTLAELDGTSVALVTLGTDGNVWERQFGGSASDWTDLGAPASVKLQSSPELIAHADGSRDLFARAANNTVWMRHFDGSSWGNWQARGGFVADAVEVIAYDGGKMALLARGFDDALWYQLYDGGWSDWQTVGVNPDFNLGSAVTAYSTGAASFDAYVRGDDDSLRKISFANGVFGAWQAEPQSTTLGSRVSVIDDGSATVIFGTSAEGGQLQRSSGGAAWVQVSATPPASVELNTGFVPFEYGSVIKLATGHMLANGREQLVLGYVNSEKKLQIHLYDVDGGFALREIDSHVFPQVMEHTRDFDLTMGDFNGDGSAEIAMFAVADFVLSGGRYNVANTKIVDFDGSQLRERAHLPFTVVSPNRLQYVGIAAGNFNDPSHDDLAVVYSTYYNGHAPDLSAVRVVSVDYDPDQPIEQQYQLQYETASVMFNEFTGHGNNMYVDIAAADVTGHEVNYRKDEIVAIRPKPDTYGVNSGSTLHVYDVNADNSITQIEYVGWFTNNQPVKLATGDVDRDLVDEIAVTYERKTVSGNRWLTVYNMLGGPGAWNLAGQSWRNYGEVIPHFDIAMGDFSGESLRVGTPSYRLQHNVGSIAAIINAPPSHADTLDGTEYAINFNNPDTFAEYQTASATTVSIDVGFKRSTAVDKTLDATVGDPDGTHTTTSLEKSYGSEFSLGRETLQGQTIEGSVRTDGDDAVIYTAASYQVWEYPLYKDDSGVVSNYITLAFPVANSETTFNDPGQVCNGWYQPDHQLHNIWSYPAQGFPDRITGYDASRELYNTVASTGGIISGWSRQTNTFSAVELSNSIYSSVSRGLETQVGGDEFTFTAEIPIIGGASVSKNIVTPSLKGSINGTYSGSQLSTQTVTTSNELTIRSSMGSVDSNESYRVQSYLFRAAGGYLALDHTTEPLPQSFWNLYDKPDPAFRRPWHAGICNTPTEDKSDFSPEIKMTPAYATPGSTVVVSATVHNYSNVVAPSFTVRFYVGDPANGGVQVGSEQTVNNLNRPSGGQVVSTSFTATGYGEQRVYAVIDPTNTLVEMHDEVSNVNNNVAYGLLNLGAAAYVDPGSGSEYYKLGDGYEGIARNSAETLTYSGYIALDAMQDPDGEEDTVRLVELLAVETDEAAPAGLTFVGEPIELKVYDAGTAIDITLQPTGDSPSSVIKIGYDGSLPDNQLVVRRWDSGTWTSAGCDGQAVQQLAATDQFVVPVCETGRFAVFNTNTPTSVGLATSGATVVGSSVGFLALLLCGVSLPLAARCIQH